MRNELFITKKQALCRTSHLFSSNSVAYNKKKTLERSIKMLNLVYGKKYTKNATGCGKSFPPALKKSPPPSHRYSNNGVGPSVPQNSTAGQWISIASNVLFAGNAATCAVVLLSHYKYRCLPIFTKCAPFCLSIEYGKCGSFLRWVFDQIPKVEQGLN